METIDFKKDPTYKAKTEPEIITVPAMRFIMVDGEGAPESSDGANTEFQQAMMALFGVVYTIKFWDKKHPIPADYAKFTMAPVEGLWWTKSGKNFDTNNPDDWKWTVMLRVPEFVTKVYFDEVVEECVRAKKSDVYRNARLETFEEGICVQIMHVGPYSEEQPNIDLMHQFARDEGYELTGKHHELYFGDPRRTAPEKLRTILRHPVQK